MSGSGFVIAEHGYTETKFHRGVPPAPSDYGVLRGCIQKDTSINSGNLGGTLLDGKRRDVGMNISISTTLGSNAGIGFAVPCIGSNQLCRTFYQHIVY